MPSTAPSPAPGEPGRFPGAAGALAGYVILTIALTWPLAWHLTEALPFGNNDLWQNYWNFWWWGVALLEGRCPYSTDLLFHPGETSLAFHTHSEANILLTFPVQLLAGIPAALNLATLLGFVLAGWGAYLLARELTGERRAAFLAGVVFAFFPQHFEQSLEHLNLASYGAMPLFLLGLLRGMRRGGVSAWALAALGFALNALFSWHNGLLILPAAVLLFARELWLGARPRRRVLAEAALAGLASALLLLPFLWPMLREMLEGGGSYIKPAVDKPLDLLFLVVPAERHTLWGSLFGDAYQRLRSYPSAGFTGYLGAGALALAALGFLPRWRRASGSAPGVRFPAGLWLAVFAVYIVLSLGAELRLAGHGTGVPLPFALLEEAPLFRTLRVANRFLVPAMLALALLAARGGAGLLAGSRRPGALFGLLLLILAADYLWLPYPVREPPQPLWVAKLAAAPEGSLLDIPGGYRARAADDMYLQTLHGRPLAGGYVSVVPARIEERLAAYPALRVLFEGRPAPPEPGAEPFEDGLERLLRELPIAAVAVHLDRVREDLEARRAAHRGTPRAVLYNPEKGMPRQALEEARAALRRLWGEPYHADAEVELYFRPR
jgi:hypothetical protein